MCAPTNPLTEDQCYSFNQLIRDEQSASRTHDYPLGSDVDRRDHMVPIILLKINAAAKFNQLFHAEGMPIVGSEVDRRDCTYGFARIPIKL
jgi:hypothetical protein